MSTDSTTAGRERGEGPAADLRAAAEDLQRAEDRVAEFGREQLTDLADAHEEFTALLDRYEDRATGDGDFQAFIEFQSQIADLVERLDDDLLLRETFEEADDRLQQRRLKESDFEQVRRNFEPVADLAGRLDERQAALEAYRSARAQVRQRRADLGDRIQELERLQRLGDADLDAPVDRLREPIATYNDAAREAFEALRREAPAREVLAYLESVEPFPLVDFSAPPAELREYVERAEAGTESIPRLLDFAEYSRSKLDHYVADPGALKTAVRPNTTYLRRLDGEPLTVDWPPPAAGSLAWECRERRAAIARLAPDVVEALRAVEALPRTTDYERLRTAAEARTELTDDERERLQAGEVVAELDERRAELERIEAALAEHPKR